MTKARDLANAGTALTSVSATELGYLDGVTSAVQTQIDSKIGQSTAINPTIVDAKGDIIAATAADTVARLAVGSNNTVLTADSAEATGLKWAAPSPSALTLIHTETLSAVSSVNIDNKFTSTYSNYLILMNIEGSTAGYIQTIQWRSGGTTISSGYKGTYYYTEYTNNTWNVTSSTTDTYVFSGTSGTDRKYLTMQVGDPQASEFTKSQILSTDNTYNIGWNSVYPQTTSIDGIRTSASTGTMTGTIRIYGYQNN